MAGQSKPKITDKDITGLKCFEKLLPLLRFRRQAGMGFHFGDNC